MAAMTPLTLTVDQWDILGRFVQGAANRFENELRKADAVNLTETVLQALSAAAILARDYYTEISKATNLANDGDSIVTVDHIGLLIVRDRNTLKWILQEGDLKNWAELQEMYRNNADGMPGGEPYRWDPPNASTMNEPAPDVVAKLLAEANERRARWRIYAGPVIKAIRAGMIADGIPIRGLVFDPVAAL